jgi:thioredoxin-related protein
MNRTAIALVCAALAPTALARQGDTPAKPRDVQPMRPIATPGTVKPEKAADKPDLYNEKADAKDLINAALVKAKKENRRVLIQWGFNTCSWCQLLHREFGSGKLAHKLMYEYDVVYVEAAKNKANAEVAKGYGADLQTHGYPYLTILDASGKAIANQETGSLEAKDEKGQSLLGEKMAHDETKVLAFLTDHQAAYLQADAVVKDGLDQAKSSGRKVFLHFGAPWCGWCHKLEDWMAQDEIASTFAKDFVEVKVDQDRMLGAKEVEEAYKMPKDSGIPWFLVIDPATGKTLSTSTGPDGNIGYPAKNEEIKHFMGMLEGAHKNLTAADLEKIKASLVAAGEKINSQH